MKHTGDTPSRPPQNQWNGNGSHNRRTISTSRRTSITSSFPLTSTAIPEQTISGYAVDRSCRVDEGKSWQGAGRWGSQGLRLTQSYIMHGDRFDFHSWLFAQVIELALYASMGQAEPTHCPLGRHESDPHDHFRLCILFITYPTSPTSSPTLDSLPHPQSTAYSSSSNRRRSSHRHR